MTGLFPKDGRHDGAVPVCRWVNVPIRHGGQRPGIHALTTTDRVSHHSFIMQPSV